MTKKLHLLIVTILLFTFQITNAQTSNMSKNSDLQIIKSKVEQLIVNNATGTRISGSETVLNYRQGAFGVDLSTMLNNNGLNVVDELGSGDLDTLLPSESWDLVILQIHDLSLSVSEITAISDYVTAGGNLIISYWNLNNAPNLQTIVGVSNTISFNAPIDISVWNTTHAIFNSPNTIVSNDLLQTGDNGGADNGDRLEPVVGANALAGFALTITTNEAAIVLANNNKTIYHGFNGLDINLNSFINLVENEVNFLLNPATGDILNYTQNGFGVDLNPMLIGNGFSVVDMQGSGNLDTILTSQSWDLAILQIHDENISASEITAISDYATAGGKLIISYWNLNNAPNLQTIVGVSNTISFNTPIDISVWNTTHAIFNSPNTIVSNDLLQIGDNGGNDNGDRLEPAVGANALAGFALAITTNEAAIVLANNNKTIYHGFSGLDINLNSFTNLVENEIDFLINNTASVTDFGSLFSVYPNPTEGNISINLGATYQDVKITTRNILGQTIDIQKYNSFTNDNFYIKGMTGFYFIDVQTQNGKHAVIKVLKK